MVLDTTPRSGPGLICGRREKITYVAVQSGIRLSMVDLPHPECPSAYELAFRISLSCRAADERPFLDQGHPTFEL